LLFVGTSSDRKFRARSTSDGSVLWEHALPAATEGVPAVYEADGRQFVAIAVGGTGMFSQGLPQEETGPGHYRVFALPRSAQGN
jgi:quinoprotein glucose dehydrogenase